MKGYHNKGFIMITTSLILVVLLVLSAFVLTFMLNERHQSIQEENKMAAYYIARAGAEATEKAIFNMADGEIEKLMEKLNKSPKPLKVNLDNLDFENGDLEVELEKVESSDNIRIVSKGRAFLGKDKKGNDSYVEVIVRKVIVGERVADKIELNYAIFAASKLIISGNPNVEGDIGIGKNGEKVISGKINLKNGRIREGIEVAYPLMDFPDIPSVDKVDGSASVKSIGESVEFSQGLVTFDNVEIDTIKGDIDIIVNSISFNKDLIIKGSGKVRLFVKNQIYFNDNSSKINKNGDPNKLEIYYYGKGINISTNCDIWANIFLKDAGVNISGNTITGSVFCNGVNSMNISGNVNNGFIYAPRSQINISGNGKFSNGIVGNEIIISGQCDITFRKMELPTDLFEPNYSDKIKIISSYFE